MDQPRHGAQRKTVAPMFTPTHLDQLAINIRKRSAECLDNLPRHDVFDWVDRVSIELTTQMLAVLFDFPWEDRRKLTRWSDVATTIPGPGRPRRDRGRAAGRAIGMRELFRKALERAHRPAAEERSVVDDGAQRGHPRHGPEEFPRQPDPLDRRRQRHHPQHLTGSIYALNKNPDQYRKLRENPALIDSFVPEVIRWQTPLAHMRRTALEDIEFRGKQIKKGDKVVMWYVSGNRDDEVIDRPYEFIIDRARPRTHLSFGFGIHRCVGFRLAELQLKIIWEEILKRFDHIEVVDEPKRVYSSFVKGYETLPVRIAG